MHISFFIAPFGPIFDRPHLREHLLVPQNLVYTGARNGSIKRYDTRQPSFESQSMLENRFMHMKTTQRPSNSIVYMNVVNGWQLLVSAIDGTVSSVLSVFYDFTFEATWKPEEGPWLTLSRGALCRSNCTTCGSRLVRTLACHSRETSTPINTAS